MKQTLSVFNSDAINRYGMKFTIGALETALEQSWLMGVPHLISHDIHRPIGWVTISVPIPTHKKLRKTLDFVMFSDKIKVNE